MEGDVWSAKSVAEEKIPKGTQVKILKVDGVKAVVTTDLFS